MQLHVAGGREGGGGEGGNTGEDHYLTNLHTSYVLSTLECIIVIKRHCELIK